MRARLLATLLIVACAKSPQESNEETSTGSESTSSTTTTGPASESSTGLPQGTGCCAPHDGPGCDEAAVQSCVCDAKPECCTFHWDEACVDAATNSCAATCMPDPAESSTGAVDTTGVGGSSTDTGMPAGGSCCEGTGTRVGCDDQMVTDCVCAVDDYCCNMGWDPYCVAEAADCGVDCMNDCCTAHEADACNDIEVFECTVMQNDGCLEQWTMECVDTAMNACGLMCA